MKIDKQQILKRVKSFAWRLGALTAVVAVDFLLGSLGMFDIPTEIAVIVGLMGGELTKYLNTKYALEAFTKNLINQLRTNLSNIDTLK